MHCWRLFLEFLWDRKPPVGTRVGFPKLIRKCRHEINLFEVNVSNLIELGLITETYVGVKNGGLVVEGVVLEKSELSVHAMGVVVLH